MDTTGETRKCTLSMVVSKAIADGVTYGLKLGQVLGMQLLTIENI